MGCRICSIPVYIGTVLHIKFQCPEWLSIIQVDVSDPQPHYNVVYIGRYGT